MFSQYFGRYLWERGILSKAALDAAADLPYPAFVDKLLESSSLSREEAEEHLAGFRAAYGLADVDIEEINSGDIDRILPLFLHFRASGVTERRFSPAYVRDDPKLYNDFVRLAVNSLARFISAGVLLKKAKRMQKYAFECLAYQAMGGAHHVFFGIAGKGDSLLAIANAFARQTFSAMDRHAYDSICEFVNSINGLYASELSNEKILLELSLPCWDTGKTITSTGTLHCLPVIVDDAEIDLLFSFDNDVSIL